MIAFRFLALVAVVAVVGAFRAALPRAMRSSTSLNANLLETVKSAGTFKTLVAALEAAGLQDALTSPGPFTVFAPSDDAFEKLPAGTVEGLLKDPKKLATILQYHVVPQKMKPTRNGKNWDTLCMGEDGFPKQLVVKVTNWACEMYIFGGQTEPSKVTTPPGNCDMGSNYEGVACDNGVIHQINEVLIPYEGTIPPKITFIGAGDIEGTKTLQTGGSASHSYPFLNRSLSLPLISSYPPTHPPLTSFSPPSHPYPCTQVSMAPKKAPASLNGIPEKICRYWILSKWERRGRTRDTGPLGMKRKKMMAMQDTW